MSIHLKHPLAALAVVIGASFSASDARAVDLLGVHDAASRNDPQLLAGCLAELRELLHAGRLGRLELMFRDGVEARVERSHRWRFWRRASEFLE